jgi:4'-phosphopantetheinyl transferase
LFFEGLAGIAISTFRVDSKRFEGPNVPLAWSIPPGDLALDKDAIDLWFSQSLMDSAEYATHYALLSSEEQKRASAFRFDADRIRYVNAHGALRRVLSRYAGGSPRELRFTKDRFGKPGLKSLVKVSFNMSDSEEAILVAVSNGIPVGVDIEKVREIPDAADLARKYFSPAESALVTSCAGPDRDRTFLHLWTRKEAVVKAEGGGLSISLNRFDCTGDLVLIEEGEGGHSSSWRVMTIECDQQHVAALALPRSYPTVRHFLLGE